MPAPSSARPRIDGLSLAGAVLAACFCVTPGLNAQGLDPEVRETLSAVVAVQAKIPANARTASALGTERQGSGVVIDANGLIVTIGYLILEASEVEVAVTDGRTVPAEIVAYDHNTGFGLLRATQPLNLPPMGLGTSAHVDEWDHLLISAFGGVDAVRPAVAVSRREFAGYWEYLLEGAIFTVPPYPLFGGAALIDNGGRLVGIGSLVVGDAVQGERTMPGNMFIPIDALKAIMGDLLLHGRAAPVSRPWIGVYSQEEAEHVRVQRVAEGGPASRAGMRAGDIIAEVDHETVSTLAGFYRKLWKDRKPGDRVRITVLRGAELHPLNVETGDRYAWLRLAPSE
jgi:S1-C subfamily serine protease